MGGPDLEKGQIGPMPSRKYESAMGTVSSCAIREVFANIVPQASGEAMNGCEVSFSS